MAVKTASSLEILRRTSRGESDNDDEDGITGGAHGPSSSKVDLDANLIIGCQTFSY